MVDTVTITRKSTTFTWNDAVGTDVQDPDQIIYSGSCILSGYREEQMEEAAGEERQLTYYWLEIPISAPQVQPEDIVTVDSIHPNGPQNLVGRVFRVREELTGTYSVAQRVALSGFFRVPQSQ